MKHVDHAEGQKSSRLLITGFITVTASVCALVFLQLVFDNAICDNNLPSSCRSQPLPPTGIVIEVDRNGTATLNGKTVEGLGWPIENSGWLGRTRYWSEVFVPNGKMRWGNGHSGYDVPVKFRLHKELEFTPPAFQLLLNVWLETTSEVNTGSEGLSLCFADPDDLMPDRRRMLWIYWHGGRCQVSFTKGCLPVYLLPGRKYRIPESLQDIWIALPTSYPHSQFYRLYPTPIENPPKELLSATRFAKLLDSIGSGSLLCVQVEKGVTVQEVIDFMTLCEDLNQPWTFYFEPW